MSGLSRAPAWTLGLAFAFALGGCPEERPPGSPPPTPKPAKDAAPGQNVRRSRDAAAVPPKAEPDDQGLSELVGSWRATADTDEYGRITASVTVEGDGRVRYRITGETVPPTVEIRLLRWDGQVLRVSYAEGSEVDVPATMKDSDLAVTLPIAGTVLFERTAPPERAPVRP